MEKENGKNTISSQKNPKKIKSHKIKLRNTQLNDYESIKEIMNLVYSNAGGTWTKEEFTSQLLKFPEGQFCIEDNGKLVAGSG